MKNSKYSNEQIKAIASEFETKKTFELSNRKVYRAMCYRGKDFIEECCSHMPTLSQRFSDIEIAEKAMEYETRNAFCEGANRHYQQACKRKILDKVCSHMSSLFKEWDEQNIRAVALECETRSEFSQKFSQAYKKSKGLGIFEEVCEHMEHKSPPRSNDTVAAEAKLCKTRKEFETRFSASYKTAQVRGTLDSVCSHMKLQHQVWSKEKIGIIAKQYLTRKAFEVNSPLAYDAARRWEIKQEVCSHMVPGKSFEYDKLAYLYFAEVNNGEAYKVGVTNNGFERRFRDEKTPIKSLRQWTFKTGREAFDVEQSILKQYQGIRLKGAKVLRGTGNTELLSENILDKVIQIINRVQKE